MNEITNDPWADVFGRSVDVLGRSADVFGRVYGRPAPRPAIWLTMTDAQIAGVVRRERLEITDGQRAVIKDALREEIKDELIEALRRA